VMRFLFLTALISLRLSLVTHNEQYSFSKIYMYNVHQVILNDANGFVWLGTMSGVNRYHRCPRKVFHKQHDDSSLSWSGLEFYHDWCKLFSTLKPIQCVS
jgi:ligand-binding sensor domain-containing protein